MTERYNGFLLTHKSLRAMLYDAALHLQQMDAGCDKQISRGIQKLEKLMIAFDKHASLEDEYILPLIKQKAPQLFNEFEGEHHKDKDLTEQLCQLIRQYRSDSSNGEMLARLFYCFNHFLAFNIEHMNKEEIILNREIWHHYSDEELQAVHQEIIRTRDAEERETSVYWMFKGCSVGELTQLLKGAQQGMPPGAFKTFYEQARRTVESAKWCLIKSSLSETVSCSTN